jgi:hypothetical protein
LEASQTTTIIGTFTLGLRIHHGYVGLLLVIAAPLFHHRGVSNAMLMTGIGLLGSDLLHHFAVLWPLTGSPEFYLFYPRAGK